ncbi:TolC family protein [Noviherbaspirillum sp. 1P10PC]|uniref:TolC family protein n=1 Tax=Noviherbaspirillum sp. 1P10PC TaxID=3132292 RepID=UPI00399FB6DC
MNVERQRHRRQKMAALALALTLALFHAAGTSAQALPHQIFPPHADPLSTLPPVIATGATLPGDDHVAPCPAEPALPAALGLADAVDLALCHSPQLQGAWAAIRIQAAGLGTARAAFLPSLSLSASRLHSRQSTSGMPDGPVGIASSSYSASLNWRLFDFGARQASADAARLLLDAALASHDASVQKVLAEVVQAYFDAQTAQAAWDARQSQEAMAEAMLETVTRRELRGGAAQTDTLQAATALARAGLERSRAEGAYRRALAALVSALGIPAGSRLTLATDLADPDHVLRRELDSWFEQAQATHPALLAARAQLAAARQGIAAVQAEGLPRLDFNSALYINGRPNQGALRDTRETTVGVTLSIPLFDGFSHSYRIRDAQARAEQKAADLRDAQRQVMLQVAQAHADARAALANLDMSQSLLDAAGRARDSVQRRYERNAASIQDLLNTQSAHDDAQQERLRCQAEWRSAKLRLLAAAGRLGRWALAK